jgi:TOBE domain
LHCRRGLGHRLSRRRLDLSVRLATGATMKATITNRTRLVERPITWDDKVWLSWQRDAGVVLTE